MVVVVGGGGGGGGGDGEDHPTSSPVMSVCELLFLEFHDLFFI